jgi:arginyl-tRNA synthetase
MNIEEKLTTSIISAIKTLYGQDVPGKMVQLQKTKKEFEGHLTLVVFPFLKMSKKGPEQTAQEIGGYLKEHAPELVSAYNAVKGFLNLTIPSKPIAVFTILPTLALNARRKTFNASFSSRRILKS